MTSQSIEFHSSVKQKWSYKRVWKVVCPKQGKCRILNKILKEVWSVIKCITLISLPSAALSIPRTNFPDFWSPHNCQLNSIRTQKSYGLKEPLFCWETTWDSQAFNFFKTVYGAWQAHLVQVAFGVTECLDNFPFVACTCSCRLTSFP